MASEEISLSVNEDEATLPTYIKGIIDSLASRGCQNLTSSIDLTASSNRPYTGGGFCDVYRGELQNGTKIAIRSLRVYESSPLGGNSGAQKALQSTANEIYHWSKLKHRNVLPLMGLAIFKGYLSMISGWMENGNLTSYLEKNPEADRIKLCMDVCAGLSYIHTRRMAHGDLKGANVLVSPDGVAMIADFGNAQLKDLTLKFINTPNTALSIRWAAPELLIDEDGPQASMEADIYAYGMTVLEALTGKVPYHWVQSDTKVLTLVVVKQTLPPRPDVSIPDGLWGLINSCWARDASERPNATSIGESLKALILSPEDVINSATSIEEIIGVLVESGCPDLTDLIDPDASSEVPVAIGGYGNVYPGTMRDGARIAIKVSRVYEVSQVRGALKRAAREMFHRSKLKHPNLLPLMGLAVSGDNMSIISEWMENGNLMTYLKSNPGVDRISLCMDICAGLCYVHAEGMVHGDLKGTNIIISRDGTGMIASFGNLRREFAGAEDLGISLRWAAPELLVEDGPRSSMEADVYAYGMTVLEALTGNVPYEDVKLEYRVVYSVAIRKEVPRRLDMIPDGLWELLNSCWAYEPAQRPKITSVRDQLDALFPSSKRTTA